MQNGFISGKVNKQRLKTPQFDEGNGFEGSTKKSSLIPTSETTIFTIDGIEIETKAKVLLEKGDGKQRLIRKPVRIPGANY